METSCVHSDVVTESSCKIGLFNLIFFLYRNQWIIFFLGKECHVFCTSEDVRHYSVSIVTLMANRKPEQMPLIRVKTP